jgi:hypothetical protein
MAGQLLQSLWKRLWSRSSRGSSEFVVLKKRTMELSKPTTTWFSLGQMVMLVHQGEEGMRYSIAGIFA